MDKPGTDAYDKWLSEYRKNKFIYLLSGSPELRIACYMNRETRTNEQQKIVELRYIRQETHAGNEQVNKMIIKHKKAYYKEMEKKQAMVRWKAFDEVPNRNADMKRESKNFL